MRADVSLGPDNRSRGYGTVLLATAEDAGRAVDMFNGYSWQARILEVRLDRLLPDFDSLGSSSASSSSSQTYLTPTSKSTSPPTAEEIEFMSLYHANDPNSCRNLFVGNVGNYSLALDNFNLFWRSFRFIANGRISRTCFVKPEQSCARMLLSALTGDLVGSEPSFLRRTMTLYAPSRCLTGT